ncbi:PstS family phosphate ABC transporter substrate-binding protein [Caulobacter segnis]
MKDIVEIKIELRDGIVVATDKQGPDFNFKLEQLYLGLADQSLRGGQLVKQPYKNWNEVGQGLPKARILVYGPPPTSGTRDAFVELAMEGGAAKLPTLAKMKTDDEKKFKATVSPMRTDGGWVDAGENDNAIVGTIEKTPNALGVFGFSFLGRERLAHQGRVGQRREADPATIASGQYPLSRSLYIYVKKSQSRRDAGPEGIHHRVRLGLRHRSRRLPARPRSDPAAPGPAPGHEGQGRRAAGHAGSKDQDSSPVELGKGGRRGDRLFLCRRLPGRGVAGIFLERHPNAGIVVQTAGGDGQDAAAVGIAR